MDDLELFTLAIGSSIEVLADELLAVAHTAVPRANIQKRIKDKTILQKKKKLKNITDVLLINDVYGFRILVDNEDEAYLVLQAIEQKYVGFIDHDYLAHPKISNEPILAGKKFRTLQFIALRGRATFEVQITTRIYNEINETLHARYHERKYR